MRVVGIDPGTNRIGYAVVEGHRGAAALLAAETIVIPGDRSRARRLTALEQALALRLARDRPDAVALETLFFGKNMKTATAVAEARGVILLTAFRTVTSIWEYAPLQVKMAVAGSGRVGKSEMQRAVQMLLPRVPLPKGDDAVDAIAVALTGLAIQGRTDGNASGETPRIQRSKNC